MSKSNLNDYGKLPPQAIELEEVVLGAILIEANAIIEISEILRSEFLYKEAHRIIYAHIISLYNSNSPVDMLTVTDSLRKSDELDNVGGVMYLSDLTSRVGSAKHAAFHVAIIVDMYMKREVIRISAELGNLAYDEDTDVQDIIDEADRNYTAISDLVSGAQKGEDLPELLTVSLESFDRRHALYHKGFSTGIKTPLFELTKILHGWQKGDFILLAARPAMGKTAFALAIAKTAAKTHSVLIFSLEMTAEKLSDRMIIGESGVNSDNYFEGNLSPTEIQSLEDARYKLSQLKISIIDRSGLTIEQIKAISKNKQRKNRCELIIIDYLGLIRPSSGNRSYNRTNEIGEVSRKIKAMAKDLDVPVVCLAQLNRECEKRSDRRPHLSDLRDSGDIEQDCDVAMFMFRPAAYPEVCVNIEDVADVGDITIEKHRNGRTGKVKFKYNSNLTRFFDIDHVQDPYVEKEFEIMPELKF